MCGIAGKVDFRGAVDEQVVERMCRTIEHRGPDSRRVHVEDGVGLGIQRLAIIDVAGGDQPVFNEDRTVAVVMNGEIYNHGELRAELIGRGHRFRSKVDTEVIVHLYEEHGDDLVHRLRGMFAFAIWDSRRRRLLCARDRAGKKPLFWARRGSRVWFASEVRALLQDPELRAEPAPEAIGAYLAYQYVPHPLCAFRGIQKLEPASTLAITGAGETATTYWKLDYSSKLEGVPDAELRERLWEHIREATRIRLMSEVPLGAFLSGGIDSSAVVAAMAEQMSEPVKTFSIGFVADDHDERRYARMVAERYGTDHHEFVVEPDAVSILPRIARHYGEPFADPSAIPSFWLAELTSRYVTVALNGDGGDESFAGYPKYATNDAVARVLARVPRGARRAVGRLGEAIGDGDHRQTLRSRLHRRARLVAMEPWERYSTWMAAFDETARRSLLTPEFSAAVGERSADPLVRTWLASTATSRIDRMLDVDVNNYLPDDLLVKIDIATMAHSLEARSPLLDQELMEFAAALPTQWKVKGRSDKRLLRSTLRGKLPDEILSRGKMGFSMPLARWLREELRDLPRDVLLDDRALGRGYFRPAAVERLLREHELGAVDHGMRIWTLLQLELWHREVVEAPAETAAQPADRA